MPAHKHCGMNGFAELDKFDVYAGDGHYISTSTHEKPVQGKKRAPGNFYTLNMRTHAMTFLTGSELQNGMKKSEHDMHALKRIGGKALRQGAKTGRKVLYVWDPAGIDSNQWQYWKKQNGVYFLSRVKESMRLVEYKKMDWDAEDPANAGVQSDTQVQLVSTTVPLRYIVYRCPDTGTEYEYLTSEMNIRPGVLAWLYKRRWDIEKTYDTFKNKLGQTKAWGESANSKAMQAQFICLAHNLMVLMEESVDIRDEKETRRSALRIELAKDKASKNGRKFAPQYHNAEKRSQFAAKFIRWLRYHLNVNSIIADAINDLRRIYAMF